MSASHRIQDVIELMVELAPPRLAADWDNVGLMVGDPSRPLRGITVALDPTLEAVEEAIAQGSNLVVVHHPLLFKPPRSLDLRKEPGRTLQALIKADCALYAAHTNLDATAVNVALAQALGLNGTDLLHRTGEGEGWGLVGDLTPTVSLAELGRRAKDALGIQAARIVGPADRPIRRVAWLGGSGGDYWKEALAAKADAYITGEVRHHAALDALAAGLCFVEVGHVGSEQPVVPFLAAFLQERLGQALPVRWLRQVDPFVVV